MSTIRTVEELLGLAAKKTTVREVVTLLRLYQQEDRRIRATVNDAERKIRKYASDLEECETAVDEARTALSRVRSDESFSSLSEEVQGYVNQWLDDWLA